MKRKFLSLIAGIFITSATFSPIVNASITTANMPDTTGYRDTINAVITAQPPTFDSPLTVSQAALNVSSYFFETLYTFNKDFEPTPMLAESYEANPDKTSYIFKLRKGVSFHNGKEMKAEDVAASMNYWLSKSDRAKNILGEGSFEVTDDYTVTAKFKNPAYDLLNLIASRPNFPAIRTKEAIDSASEKGVEDYIGTGPYKMVEIKQDQYILLERNDKYSPIESEPSGFSGKKTPFTQFIKFHIVPDVTTRIQGIVAGTYDVTNDFSNENYAELKANNNIRLDTESGGTLTLFYNVKKGPLSSLDVRKAVTTGINNEDIMLASFIEPDLFSLNPGYMNPSMPQWASDAGSEMYNLNDPGKAKEMLDKAGYKGEKIKILTSKDYNEMYQASLVLSEQLKSFGMDSEVLTYDFPTFMEKKDNPDNWDIFITSNGYQVTPQQLLVLNPKWAGVDDPKLQEMVKNLKNAEDQTKKKEIWDSIQSYLYNDYLSSIALGQYMSVSASSVNLEEYVFWQAPILWNSKIKK